LIGSKNKYNKLLTYRINNDNIKTQGELEMSNENKAKTVSKVVEPLEPDPAELTCTTYGFFRNSKNGVFYTVKIKFDQGLTTAEFSDKEVAGDEKQLAVERLKILLGSKVF
jgi:hypothetical protein